MSSELTIAVLTGLGGMLGWGLADFFAKKTIDEIGDIVSLVWAHIFGTLVILLTLVIAISVGSDGISLPHTINAYGLLIFFGILQALVYIFVYVGFGKGQVSLLNPIFASFSGLVALISILFLGESANGHIFIVLFGIFLGVMLLSIDAGAWKTKGSGITHTPGSKEIILATILATIWTIGWSKFIDSTNWITYSLLMYVFMTIFLLIYSKSRGIILSFQKTGIWKSLFLIGICEVAAYLAISLGYGATSKTSIVAILSGAFSLPTIILARIFLKERITKIHLLGIVLIVFGVILISVL